MVCRVTQAHKEMEAAKAAPTSAAGRAILQQVYYPGFPHLPALRRLASFVALRNAMKEVQGHSWWQSLKARSSWLLHPTEARSWTGAYRVRTDSTEASLPDA